MVSGQPELFKILGLLMPNSQCLVGMNQFMYLVFIYVGNPFLETKSIEVFIRIICSSITVFDLFEEFQMLSYC